MRRRLCSGRPVPGACASGLPTARRRSPDAWRARRAWSRAAAWSGALTPPWPRSASASAARVTVTKHCAPPCHNKSPGAPAAGDPYPLLAGATTLRGRQGSAAGCALEGATRFPPPHPACTAPRATADGARSWFPTASSAGARSPPSHPPGCLCWCHASNPRRRAATRRASGRSRGGLGVGGARIRAAVLRGPGRHAWEEREGGSGRRARRGGSSPSCRCRAEGAGRGSGRP